MFTIHKKFAHTCMQFKYLADLRTEFKKFTGFMTPEIIREPATKAVSLLASDDICLPIEEPSCPIVQAFMAIMNSKKITKTWPTLMATMCSCISSDAMTGDALIIIIQSLENVSNMIDYETGLRIIRFTTESVGSKFLEIPIFRAILSLVLALCASKIDSLNTACIAGAKQILSSFIEFSESQANSLSPVNIRDINTCFAKSCQETVTFEQHLDKIIYLIMRDLSRLCNNETAVWLHHYSIDTAIPFCLIEQLVGEHPHVFSKSKHFLQLISNTIHTAERVRAPLSFSVTVMDVMMEAIPEECRSHFSYFVRCLDDKGMSLHALRFFRVFLMKRPSVIIRFFKNCDTTAVLLSKFIEKLKDVTDSSIGSDSIELSLNPMGLDGSISPSFMRSAPVEIAVYFVRSCFDSRDPEIKTLVSGIWSNIIAIITISLTCVGGRSCHLLLQNLHLLICLASELDMDDIRGMVITAFCSVLMSPNEEVRKVGYDTLTYAVESSPCDFVGYWAKVLPILADFQWEPNTLDFSLLLKQPEEIAEVAVTLVEIRDDETMHAWALNLLSNILIENDERFDVIWNAIRDKYMALFKSGSEESETIESFLMLMTEGFTTNSEELICEATSCIMKTGGDLAKQCILENIKTLLTEQGPTIKNGWIGMLKALSPENFKGNETYVNLAFSCVTIICNDVLFIVPEEIQNKCIEIIFEFAAQKEDVNVSLSAFGLLWNVISIAKTAKMWITVFQLHIPLISDTRGEVSICAVKTMFSLIMSNWQTLPHEVFAYFGSDCLKQIIKNMADPPEDSDSTQQMVFHEIAHCGRILWDQFKDNEDFTYKVWNDLIDLHIAFMQKCQKRDALVAAFQFYEEAYQCDGLSRELKFKLFDKLDTLTDFLIRTESAKSALFGSMGRLIRIILPTQKGLDDESLERWLNIIGRLVFDLHCDGFLPPTTHKSLDALCDLFPLPVNQVEMIYKLLVSMACNPMKNIRLTEVALQHICDICEQRISDDVVPRLFVISANLFKLKPARRLLLFFVEKDMMIHDEMVEHVYHSLIKLGQSEPELTVKTGIGILKLFLRLSDEIKLDFITAQASCFETQAALWKQYLAPDSASFDETSAILCTRRVVGNVGNFLPDSRDEELFKLLHFLKETKSFGPAFGENRTGNYRHINSLLPYFADLVIHPNEEIRKMLREVFLLLVDE